MNQTIEEALRLALEQQRAAFRVGALPDARRAARSPATPAPDDHRACRSAGHGDRAGLWPSRAAREPVDRGVHRAVGRATRDAPPEGLDEAEARAHRDALLAGEQ